MKAIIFGSGPSRALIDKVPAHIFTVSCNLSYPNANLIFAQDEPILEKLNARDVKGLTTQAIFAPFRMYEKFGGKRVMLLDEDKLWPNSQGLSTGVLAIGTMVKLGFNKIYLCGFEFTKERFPFRKLGIIGSSNYDKLYRIVDSEAILKVDMACGINYITPGVFYNEYRTIT